MDNQQLNTLQIIAPQIYSFDSTLWSVRRTARTIARDLAFEFTAKSTERAICILEDAIFRLQTEEGKMPTGFEKAENVGLWLFLEECLLKLQRAQ